VAAGMTPEEIDRFTTWWKDDVPLPEIAVRLGVPLGTVSSRAVTLRRLGYDLPKRPTGGASPLRIRRRGEAPAPPPARRPRPASLMPMLPASSRRWPH
jgi:hypothetical protein